MNDFQAKLDELKDVLDVLYEQRRQLIKEHEAELTRQMLERGVLAGLRWNVVGPGTDDDDLSIQVFPGQDLTMLREFVPEEFSSVMLYEDDDNAIMLHLDYDEEPWITGSFDLMLSFILDNGLWVDASKLLTYQATYTRRLTAIEHFLEGLGGH